MFACSVEIEQIDFPAGGQPDVSSIEVSMLDPQVVKPADGLADTGPVDGLTRSNGFHEAESFKATGHEIGAVTPKPRTVDNGKNRGRDRQALPVHFRKERQLTPWPGPRKTQPEIAIANPTGRPAPTVVVSIRILPPLMPEVSCRSPLLGRGSGLADRRFSP